MQTCDISGKGGDYENECQKILKAGLEFLANDPGSIVPKDFPNEEGLFESEPNVRLRKLGLFLTEQFPELRHDKMIFLVIGHMRYLTTHGKTKWIKEYTDAGKADKIFEWDGTVATIPKPKG